MTTELDKDAVVVVAGAGGFIGGHLVSRLLRDGHSRIRAVDYKPVERWYQPIRDVETLQLDLTELAACRQALRGATYVFDLAADMGGMGFIEAHRAECMLSVLIGAHLLVAARDAGSVERLFYASSACVYNVDLQRTTEVVPLKEEDAYPAMPEDGYGWEKLFTERLCHHFTEDFGLATRVARFHNVFGTHGTWAGGREKAPAAICRKVAEAKLTGADTIEIWGDGEQTRSFMYIDDCIEGTMRIFKSDHPDPLNVGSSEIVTINGLVDIVEKIAGVKLRRTYDLSAPLGVRGRNSDNQRLRSVVGWEPATSLEDGLERTYRWVYDQVSRGRADPIQLDSSMVGR